MADSDLNYSFPIINDDSELDAVASRGDDEEVGADNPSLFDFELEEEEEDGNEMESADRQMQLSFDQDNDDDETQIAEVAEERDDADYHIPMKEKPHSTDQLMIIRLPNTAEFCAAEYEDHKRANMAEDRGAAPAEGDCISWRFARDEKGDVIKDENGNLKRETNTHLIKWSDGSYTIRIGNKQFECQLSTEKTYLFETSAEPLKLFHAESDIKAICRPFNSVVRPRKIGKAPAKSREQQFATTRLITASEFWKSSTSNGVGSMESSPKKPSRNREEEEEEEGLTERFLESSSGSDDDSESSD